MRRSTSPLYFALSLLAFFSHGVAEIIPVRSGSIVVDLDPVALAALNIGSDPAVGAMILEEFFRGDADRNRSRNQIVQDQIVPNFTAIPTKGLKFDVNGDSVTNINPPARPIRRRKPSTFSYDPGNVIGTASGEIGLTGCLRFIGDFTGIFVIGDLTLRYNLPSNQTEPDRGWVFVNNFDFAGTPAFETANVITLASGGKLVVKGDLTISRELDLFFLPGDRGKKIGTFRLETPLAPVTPPPLVTATRQPGGNVQLSFLAKGNAVYKVEHSPDLQSWVPVTNWQVTGENQVIEWTDAGPPATPTAPHSVARRFYRILED